MDTVILIPAFQPDTSLIDTIRPLFYRGFKVLIIDDGSGEAYSCIFEQAKQYAEIVGYAKNCGKGEALKYGIRYIRDNYSQCRFFVTADADGQHTTDDICRAADSVRENGGMILGTREFEGKIPLRSRVGNDLSKFAYTIASGLYLADNQCGLRAFEIALADWLTSISGRKYEYEINVLMRAAKDGIQITELPIRTVYIGGNESSHFRPVPDTMLIHKKIWITAWTSVLAVAVNILLVILLSEHFNSSPYIIELGVLASGGAGLALSLILSLAFSHFVSMRVIKFAGIFLINGILRIFFQLLFTEVICRATRASLPISFIFSATFVLFIEYFVKKGIYWINSRLSQTHKEVFDEKVH